MTNYKKGDTVHEKSYRRKTKSNININIFIWNSNVSQSNIMKNAALCNLMGIYSVYVREEGDIEITTEKAEKAKKKAGKLVKKYLEQHIPNIMKNAALCNLMYHFL